MKGNVQIYILVMLAIGMLVSAWLIISSKKLDFARISKENLCDVVVARDPSMAADIYCLDDDCSDEIQSAIDTVASKGGGVVCIRRGEYPVNRTINLKSNTHLKGEGKTTTLLPKEIPVIYVRHNITNEIISNININTSYIEQYKLSKEQLVLIE